MAAGGAKIGGELASTLITPGIPGYQSYNSYPADPTGDVAKAKITSVGTTARAPEGGDGTEQPRTTVTVKLDDSAAVSRLTAAPVQVEVTGETRPDADAPTGSPSSLVRLKSTALGGLWSVLVCPSHTWPHGNGSWKAGAALACGTGPKMATAVDTSTAPVSAAASLSLIMRTSAHHLGCHHLTAARVQVKGPLGVAPYCLSLTVWCGAGPPPGNRRRPCAYGAGIGAGACSTGTTDDDSPSTSSTPTANIAAPSARR